MAGVMWIYWITLFSTFVTGSLFMWQVFKRQQANKKKAALKPVPIERRTDKRI